MYFQLYLKNNLGFVTVIYSIEYPKYYIYYKYYKY